MLWEDEAAADEIPGDALLRERRTPNEATERPTNLRDLRKSEVTYCREITFNGAMR